MVNCSAKIDLDVLLAKHFTEAMGCNVVYFLPDSEEDVGSYTEFLQYLGVKNLAEVAIFDDGTALFFVPPSDVLSKVLKLPSPKCLYGVILNSRQNPSSTSMQPQSQSHYMNRQQRPPLPLSTEVDRGLLPKDSKFDCQGNTLTTHQLHESENQFNPQGQFSQLHTYTTSLNTSRSSSTVVTGNPQFQDPAFNLPQQGAVSSRPLSTFGIPSQGGQHQYELPENVDKDFRIVEQTDFLGSYSSSSSQQRENSITRVYDTSVVQTYTAMPLAADKGNSALGNQLQNPQSAGNGASQRTSEGEDNKYQRYMATVELAANILRERQKQQQSSNQAGKGCATPKQDFHQLGN